MTNIVLTKNILSTALVINEVKHIRFELSKYIVLVNAYLIMLILCKAIHYEQVYVRN